MKKHLKYYYALVKIQIMNFTQYRTEFFSIIAGTFAYTIVSILFINILYKNIKEIGGYNYYEVVFLFTTVQAIFYLWASFFGSTYKDIVKNIIAGSLDFYLLKPINLAFNLLTFRFDLIKLLPSILFVVYLYVYSLRSINIDYSFINLAMYLVTLLLSLFIITCYYFSVGLLSVFYGDTNELKNNIAKLNDFSKYPLPKNILIAIPAIPNPNNPMANNTNFIL